MQRVQNLHGQEEERKSGRTRGRAPIFPRVWLTSCQHVFYLPWPTFQDLLSRGPVLPRSRTHTRPTGLSAEYLVLGYHLLPSSSFSMSPALSLSSSHRRAIRPRLSHRYSRGSLEARGKMRQVVVRSRSPRENERDTPALLSSARPSVHPPVRPSARQRHSFVRVILCARVSGACVYM